MQIHVLCVMKNLRNDQRAPGGQVCRKSDLVNYFVIITRPLHPIPVRKRSSSSLYARD